MKFLEAFGSIFRIPDLRKRVLFTLAMLAVYRLGSFIPTPGIDAVRWHDLLQRSGSMLGLFDLFSGGNVWRLSVFALGIMPYITASIIMQLLTVMVPKLERLQKEGELGRRKITQWTRYLTVALGLAQSFSTAIGLLTMQENIVIHPGAGFILLTTLSLTTGSALVMWLGEQITGRGIGNGMSLIIFTGIVVRLLPATADLYTNVFVTRDWSPLTLAAVLLMMIGVVAFIVLVERGERRIPVQYARRMMGQRLTGGEATHMPVKVNAGGVVPVIFASSILAFPHTIANFPMVRNNVRLSHALGAIQHGEPLYILLFVALITFFCYFYTFTYRSYSILTKPPTICGSTADSFRASGRGGQRPLT